MRKHKNLDTRTHTSQVLRATQKFENNHILLEPLQEDAALTEYMAEKKIYLPSDGIRGASCSSTVMGSLLIIVKFDNLSLKIYMYYGPIAWLSR